MDDLTIKSLLHSPDKANVKLAMAFIESGAAEFDLEPYQRLFFFFRYIWGLFIGTKIDFNSEYWLMEELTPGRLHEIFHGSPVLEGGLLDGGSIRPMDPYKYATDEESLEQREVYLSFLRYDFLFPKLLQEIDVRRLLITHPVFIPIGAKIKPDIVVVKLGLENLTKECWKTLAHLDVKRLQFDYTYYVGYSDAFPLDYDEQRRMLIDTCKGLGRIFKQINLEEFKAKEVIMSGSYAAIFRCIYEAKNGYFPDRDEAQEVFETWGPCGLKIASLGTATIPDKSIQLIFKGIY